MPIGIPIPPIALVTETEDALAVGHDDDVDLVVRAVAQHLGDPVTVGVGDEQSAWTAVDLAEPLRGDADGRGVDDRQHLLDVGFEQLVEERSR